MALENLRAKAAELGGEDAAAEVDALAKRLARYSNLPGVLKGLAKLDFSEPVYAAALQVVRTSTPQQEVDASLFGGWALFALAARSDASVIDEVAAAVRGDYVTGRVRELRNGTKKALERRAAPPMEAAVSDEATAPASVGKVKAWLAENPSVDPKVLAPKPKQKAATVAAAVRALGQIATPAAFDVLREYATDQPTEPMLDELKRAWDSFDRREFAAAMFRPRYAGHLDLGIVTKIDGIDAVEGVTSLRIVIDDKKPGKTDLTPLAACSQLTSLQVQFNEPGGPTNIDWLRPLTGLRSFDLSGPLDGVDLAPLTAITVESLSIRLEGLDGSVLLDLPNLTELTLIGASPRYEAGDPVAPHPELTQIALTLAERGVAVTVYDFDTWSPEVLTAAAAGGLQLDAGRGTTTFRRP